LKFIFIVGFPRSGTTLFAELLSKATDYCVTPESRFYEEYNINSKNLKGSTAAKHLNKKTRLQDFSLNYDDIFNQQQVESGQILRNILIAYSNSKQNELGVIEKSPIHILHIDQIKREFPDSIVLAIVRNPSDCIKSLNKTPWNTKSDKDLQIEWNIKNTELLNNPQLDDVVRYEDLTQSPSSTIYELLNKLGFTDSIEDITQKINTERLSDAVPSWEAEWKGNVNKRVSYREPSSNSELSYLNSTLLKHFDYSLPNTTISSTKQTILSNVWRIKRKIRSAYYKLKIYKLLGKKPEGEVL